jgi:hypothetical protein
MHIARSYSLALYSMVWSEEEHALEGAYVAHSRRLDFDDHFRRGKANLRG